MLEFVLLALKKTIGVGTVGAIGMTGLGAVDDAFDTIHDYLLISATEIEISGAHKVLLGIYIRDNRYPQTKDELWRALEENYDPEKLPLIKTDEWQTSYYWLTPDWEIRSAGPDKKHETRDDFGQRYPSNVKK
jgi:hypothetical protein